MYIAAGDITEWRSGQQARGHAGRAPSEAARRVDAREHGRHVGLGRELLDKELLVARQNPPLLLRQLLCAARGCRVSRGTSHRSATRDTPRMAAPRVPACCRRPGERQAWLLLATRELTCMATATHEHTRARRPKPSNARCTTACETRVESSRKACCKATGAPRNPLAATSADLARAPRCGRR